MRDHGERSPLWTTRMWQGPTLWSVKTKKEIIQKSLMTISVLQLYNIFVDGLFHCARRYSAFIGLATALKALDPNHKFMKFPTRWTVSSTSLSVLNARKRLLSRWLEDGRLCTASGSATLLKFDLLITPS